MAVNDSIIQDYKRSSLDDKDIDYPFLGVCSPLAWNKQDISNQKLATLAMQTYLDKMMGHLGQLILAVSNWPVDNPSVADNND